MASRGVKMKWCCVPLGKPRRGIHGPGKRGKSMYSPPPSLALSLSLSTELTGGFRDTSETIFATAWCLFFLVKLSALKMLRTGNFVVNKITKATTPIEDLERRCYGREKGKLFRWFVCRRVQTAKVIRINLFISFIVANQPLSSISWGNTFYCLAFNS